MFSKNITLNIMSRLLTSFISALGILSCSAAATSNYSVKVTFTDDEDDLLLYMVNYDNGNKIDSAVVSNGVAVMEGTVGTPIMAQLVLDGNRAGSFVLESGTTEVNTNTRQITSSGSLNQQWNDFSAQLSALGKKYQEIYKSDAADKESSLKEIESKYNAATDSMFAANTGNILGYRLFLDKAYELSPAEFEAELVKYPAMAEFARVKKLRTSKANEASTSVGQKFKDFTVTNGDQVQKLSDYVGNGKWTLVDFWASWCGPCIRETATLKDLYAKYADKGLDFLGVAVWDEPANTQKAIADHQLPWPMIINAQTIPTDLYGIAGIPCIILFDPEGNIVSRGKQGAALVEDVENAMKSLE